MYAVYSVVDADGSRRLVWEPVPSGSERDAEELLARRRTEIAGGVYLRPSQATVAEWMDEWLVRHAKKVRPITMDGYERVVRVLIAPRIGRLRIQALQPRHVEDLYVEFLRTHKRSSVTAVRVVMRRALRDAVNAGLLVRSVAELVDLPVATADRRALERRPLKVWTKDELRRFLTEARAHPWGPLFQVSAATGMRIEEVCGMTWDRVDFDEAVLSTWWSRTHSRCRVLVDGPKTQKSARDIAVPAQLMDVLAQWRAEQRVAHDMFADQWYADPKDEAEGRDWVWRYLVPNAGSPAGRPVNPNHMSRVFRQITAAAELPPITFYNLRHTHGTLLLAEGRPPHEVSARLGHSTRTLIDTYVQHLRAKDLAAAAVLSDLF